MTSMDRIASLIEAGEIRTWADGFGVWHARVKNTYAFPMGVARLAIMHELQQRQGAPVAVPRLVVAERGETHDTYREGDDTDFAAVVADTWNANLRNPKEEI